MSRVSRILGNSYAILPQMFYVLVDVYLRRGNTIEVFKDVPHGLLHRIHGNYYSLLHHLTGLINQVYNTHVVPI